MDRIWLRKVPDYQAIGGSDEARVEPSSADGEGVTAVTLPEKGKAAERFPACRPFWRGSNPRRSGQGAPATD